MLQLKLARELGYTLSEITERMTFDELIIWSGFFALEAEEISKQSKRRH